MIAQFSYNARYAKYREAKNLYFPESGLFLRPADLQPSVIPYDSTFAFFIFLCLISILVLQSFYGLTNYKAAQSAAAMRACILFFQILFLCCYKVSVVILIFLFFLAHDHLLVRFQIAGRLQLINSYLYKYIYKNTAHDISALWTRHRRYRFILWVFLCGSGISVSSVRIRLHCKHGSIQPDAILSRTLKGFHGHRRKFLIQS